MTEIWNFFSGNFLDAILLSAAFIGALLPLGAALAALFSVRDETHFEHRMGKVQKTVVFLDVLKKMSPETTAIQSMEKELSEKKTNLLLLKHMAGRQAVKYTKYFILYLVLASALIGLQSWNIEKEIASHEPPVVSKELFLNREKGADGITVTAMNGLTKVSVMDDSKSASYEYVYKESAETGLLEKTYERKIVHVPDAISCAMTAAWLLFIIAVRYLGQILI